MKRMGSMLSTLNRHMDKNMQTLLVQLLMVLNMQLERCMHCTQLGQQFLVWQQQSQQ